MRWPVSSKKGGGSLWVPYTREDILGEYDFSVEAGSTQPMNDTIRKQQAVSLLNAIAPLVGTVIDPTALGCACVGGWVSESRIRRGL